MKLLTMILDFFLTKCVKTADGFTVKEYAVQNEFEVLVG